MFTSIVVGTDGSDMAREAVRQAVELALRAGARLDVVCAYEPVPRGRLREEGASAPPDAQWAVNQREDVDATLREAATAATEAGLEVRTCARQGDPAGALLDVPGGENDDLIVVGT